MARTVGRTLAGPLLFLNFAMYAVVLGISGWALNKFINGENHSSGTVGAASMFSGANHLRAWRNDTLAAAASSAVIAWVLTVLAFGVACKEIHIGNRGRRLKTLEAFIIILTFTQLLYLLLLHAGLVSSRYGPGYRDSDYTGTTTEPQKTAASVV